MTLFTIQEREALRRELLEVAQADPRITGAAITGSASLGNEDDWSDIDLAFGVRDASDVSSPLADFSQRMYSNYHALHHLDVMSGAWIYRVFLLSTTLQVDLAFAPANEFGARSRTFRLVFGTAVELPPIPSMSAEEFIGYAWLYALHVRSSLARGKLWQAEYMISEMRDHVLALACPRYGLPTREGRGMDALPLDVTAPLEAALVRSLTVEELVRAFRVVTRSLMEEIRRVAPELAARLEPAVKALPEIPFSQYK